MLVSNEINLTTVRNNHHKVGEYLTQSYQQPRHDIWMVLLLLFSVVYVSCFLFCFISNNHKQNQYYKIPNKKEQTSVRDNLQTTFQKLTNQKI